MRPTTCKEKLARALKALSLVTPMAKWYSELNGDDENTRVKEAEEVLKEHHERT